MSLVSLRVALLLLCLVALAWGRSHSTMLSSSTVIVSDGENSQFEKFDANLQTTCSWIQGSAKLATGDGGYAMVSSTCLIEREGISTQIQVSSYNPTGDDTYSINAFYWPGTIPTSDGCELPANSNGCFWPPGAPCQPPGQTKNSHLDIFNITSCGADSAAFVEFICIATPGVFNDHCEITFSIGYCGSVFVNTTNSFPTQCQF